MACLVKGCGFGNGNKKRAREFEGVQRHSLPTSALIREKWLDIVNRYFSKKKLKNIFKNTWLMYHFLFSGFYRGL